ncbi:hypothetical protein CODIS_12640 [Candidatus Thiodiazotropha endolucinida]|uniref:Uncharacterized protein n=1 Tax=Candidatus Thiodiazotropha endolucinida TaxID=1655433 RepID=A0A7Z0VM80_9GAMM|nr:hypothetical protein CODIS_12640 [Candidatus Thiodiazotropha endolucinida]
MDPILQLVQYDASGDCLTVTFALNRHNGAYSHPFATCIHNAFCEGEAGYSI